jgi:hypothetical protein
LIRQHLNGLARGALRLAMAGVPRRRRFAAALLLARALTPFVRRARMFTGLRRWPLNSGMAVSLHVVLGELLRNGIGFDARVSLAGLKTLDEAAAAGRGVLLIGPHTLLTRMAVRRLHERGYPVTAVTAVTAPAAPPGSDLPVIRRSPFFLLAVRGELARGRIVFAMVDREGAEHGITTSVETAMGTVHVADPLIHLAARCGARVVFIASRLRGAAIQARIEAPRCASDDAAATRRQFIHFVQRFAARLAGTPACRGRETALPQPPGAPRHPALPGTSRGASHERTDRAAGRNSPTPYAGAAGPGIVPHAAVEQGQAPRDVGSAGNRLRP